MSKSITPDRRLISVFANDLYVIEGTEDDGRLVARTEECEGAYILRAVNANDALTAAAERAIMALAANGAPNCEAVKELRAALRLAREG